ncbi:MAG: hypothetical protein ACI4VC_04460 [Clostridia bacterium]
MEEKKWKITKQGKESIKLLGNILTVIIIILLSVVSFVGIYVIDKNSMKNIIPEYKLGMDLYGARNIAIKVDDSTETKKYDADGNLVTDVSSEEYAEEVEEPVNSPEMLTTENYKLVKDIIEDRLNYMQVEGYLLRYDESTGEINLELPENSSTDYIAQYTITKGEFKVSDNDTSEVLLTNADLKSAKVQYNTDSTGTTVYLSIEFNKEGTKKLQDISKTYIKSEDSEGNDTTKKVKMTLDDQTIIATYFQDEIKDGIIQLSMGTSSNLSDIQTNLQQASNIAVFLNTKPMPITYKMEVNRFVYSDITEKTLTWICIILGIVAIVMAVFMIVKYRRNGIMGVIANIGFAAILLLALRFGNVIISLPGIFAIAVMIFIEYIITMLILKEYSKKYDSETLEKNIKKLLVRISITLVPLMVMAVTFALMSWQEIASVGMILFWAILIIAIYNTIILLVRLFSTSDSKKKEIKAEHKDNKTKNKTKKEKNNSAKVTSKKENTKKENK